MAKFESIGIGAALTSASTISLPRVASHSYCSSRHLCSLLQTATATRTGTGTTTPSRSVAQSPSGTATSTPSRSVSSSPRKNAKVSASPTSSAPTAAFVAATVALYPISTTATTAARRRVLQTALSLDPASAAAAMGPALLCDIARAADVSVTTVSLTSVRGVDATTNEEATVDISADAFPNTISAADCTALTTQPAAAATRARLLTAGARRLREKARVPRHLTDASGSQPALTFSVLVTVPTTVASTASAAGGSAAASPAVSVATDLASRVAVVQAKITAAIGASSASAAGGSGSASSAASLDLGPLSHLTAAWLSAHSYTVTFTGTDTATITNPEGQAMSAASASSLLSSTVQGTATAGGSALAAAVASAAPGSGNADSEARRRVGIIAGSAAAAAVGFSALVALAVWVAVRRRRSPANSWALQVVRPPTSQWYEESAAVSGPAQSAASLRLSLPADTPPVVHVELVNAPAQDTRPAPVSQTDAAVSAPPTAPLGGSFSAETPPVVVDAMPSLSAADVSRRREACALPAVPAGVIPAIPSSMAGFATASPVDLPAKDAQLTPRPAQSGGLTAAPGRVVRRRPGQQGTAALMLDSLTSDLREATADAGADAEAAMSSTSDSLALGAFSAPHAMAAVDAEVVKLACGAGLPESPGSVRLTADVGSLHAMQPATTTGTAIPTDWQSEVDELVEADARTVALAVHTRVECTGAPGSQFSPDCVPTSCTDVGSTFRSVRDGSRVVVGAFSPPTGHPFAITSPPPASASGTTSTMRACNSAPDV